ncbi:RNA splicing factor [Lithospermum erythrorhizon]|uniref:RNA splicing factor n=1 Tax=Lithospermum erythrorhizon TaxID=34254 RepID=A0AAV3R026_LITER
MDGRLVASLESSNVYPKICFQDGTPFPLSNHETSTHRLLPRPHFSSAQGLQLIQQSLIYLEFNACPVLFWFAFVYMEDERDAEDAIRRLDRFEFGRTGRRLRVEWTKQERGSSRRLESSRKPPSNSKPSKTLFVINFDPYNTKTRDLERHFDPYGKILNIRIRRNFGFIQYELQDEATKALEATNLSKLMDRVISVEYAMKDDDDKKPSYGMDRERDRYVSVFKPSFVLCTFGSSINSSQRPSFVLCTFDSSINSSHTAKIGLMYFFAVVRLQHAEDQDLEDDDAWSFKEL